MYLKEIFNKQNELDGNEIFFIARVRSHRQGKNISFIVLNDGSSLEDVQVVYKSDLTNLEEISKARVSSIISVSGILILTPGKQQSFEIQAKKIELLDQAVEDYPLQKKEHSLEFLREISHLRARTKRFNAVFKIRSEASFAIHNFFHEKNFVYVNSPIITSNDSEGAGEAFVVTTRQDANYEEDFFGTKASLTVSGQLNAEAYAQAFGGVYTFGPTFRAENSNTVKHASEFWMIEPEVMLNDLKDNINLIGDLVRYIVSYVLKKCETEIKYCDENIEQGLLTKLNNIVNSENKVMEYKEVIDVLKQAVESGYEFEEKNIYFGLDLGTEHERYICEVYNNAPTFVINYPKEIKAFYMKLNDDNKTVAAVDMLVPGIGELVGGSQRESNYDNLIQRCIDLGIDSKDLQWYLDLRKYGYYKSSGFGLGFERLIMYLTGTQNIRDVIPFPRTPKNLLF